MDVEKTIFLWGLSSILVGHFSWFVAFFIWIGGDW